MNSDKYCSSSSRYAQSVVVSSSPVSPMCISGRRQEQAALRRRMIKLALLNAGALITETEQCLSVIESSKTSHMEKKAKIWPK